MFFDEEFSQIDRGVEGAEEVYEDASRREWAKRIQSFLREKGVSFEAEGEAVRIHVDGFTVEVMEAPGGKGYAIAITIPLPSSSSEAADEEARRIVSEALRLAGLLDAEELAYELDTSIPGYPSMRIMVTYEDPEKLADALIKALGKYGVSGEASHEPLEG